MWEQRHLWKILKIKWNQYISNEEDLARASVEDIELKLFRSRLRWLGHASRTEDKRPAVAHCMVNWIMEDVLLVVQNYGINTRAKVL